MITVALVEDTTAIRQGLEILISGSPGYVCLGAFESAEEAVLRIPELQPDVVLMDIHLPGKNGVECIRQLKPLCPKTLFMMCTIYDEDELIFQSLQAGASGYILKKTPPAKLLEAISELHQGGSPMTGSIARKVIASFSPSQAHSELSDREMEILNALGQGLRYKEIAENLFISIDTVRTHIRNIYEKLQVHSRTQALKKVFPKH
jgi:DNA-binding NarL/FixJ family response regulator